MKAKKIAFTGIPVTDIKRARAFYEGVLKLKVSSEFGEGVWIEYEIGPDTLAIGSVGDQWKPSEDGTSVAIEVADMDEEIERLKRRKRV
jgi:predicted enzyme related to lactoylglutathione lyase